MASFTVQSALRAKWGSLVEDHINDVVPTEVSNKVTSVVGWLKQASLEVRAAGRRCVSSLAVATGSTAGTTPESLPSILTILHFNDVYNVEPRLGGGEPVGGAARFYTAIRQFDDLQPLILFSGDAFSPSMLSSYTKGEQMVTVLNDIGVHCAVFGNHDFDHGLEVVSEWVARSTFPWLMSNVIDNETGRPLGNGRITHVVHWASRRIGLIGLAEREWLETLPTINPDAVTFLDFVDAGQKLSAQLKQEGCDYVIALTHMRMHNDSCLANADTEIDLILGGHDHFYRATKINGKMCIKSGTDFRQFSKISVDFSDGQSVTVSSIDVTLEYVENEGVLKTLDAYQTLVDGRMDEILGRFSVPLDGRFTKIRSQETNLGNWVCDVVLAATGADLVVLNSGTFRSDQLHEAGDFTIRDLSNIIPMRDPLVVVKVSGRQIVDILENGVSKYPKLEGRFPQVAGVSFAFDPDADPGERIDANFVRIGDEYVRPDQMYSLATKHYLYAGCDGYVMLRAAEVLVDEGECPELGLAIQNHFQAINMRLGKTSKHSRHRQSLVTLSRRHSLVKMLDTSDLDGPPPVRRSSCCFESNSNTGASSTVHSSATKLIRRASLDDLEQESCQLSPKTDNRIVVITSDEVREELRKERLRNEQDSVIVEVDECLPSN